MPQMRGCAAYYVYPSTTPTHPMQCKVSESSYDVQLLLAVFQRLEPPRVAIGAPPSFS